jgi:hypothetical protein
LLALALAVPALALATSAFAAAARKGERPGRGWRWALGWLVAPAAGLALLAALALTGIVPSPAAPFDPAAFELGPAEAVAIAAVALAGLAAWWALGLRRLPIGLPRPALAAGCVLAAAAPLTVVWVVNPFTALLLVPLLHPLAAFALAPRARRPAIAVLAIVALAPLALGLAHVAAELGWGADAPWQLAMLASGGGAGPIWLLGVVGTLAAAAALVWAGVAPERRRVPPPPGAPTRGGPVTPPARA